MSSNTPAAPSGNAIHAAKDYVRWGQGASKNFGFLKHLGICTTLGLGLGLTFKVGRGRGPCKAGGAGPCSCMHAWLGAW